MSTFDKKRFRINNAFKKFINSQIPPLLFTDTEISYLSNPYHCKFRNLWLLNNNIHHICDAYACIGADTIQFMAIKPNVIIDSIQISNTHDLKAIFNRLDHNIRLCSFLNPNVHLHSISITDFINFNNSFNTVDFLYCDPPWTDIHNNWFDSFTLISNVNFDIFQPLILNNHKPKFICFKVPFHWNDFISILNFIPFYHYHSSCKFHFNSYWFHFILLH